MGYGAEAMLAVTSDMFVQSERSADNVQQITLPDAQVSYHAAFFNEREATQLFQQLRSDVAWQQQHIRLYGKEHTVPRLTAWYGDAGRRYAYSGITLTAREWLPVLLDIRARVEHVARCSFNSVLLNLYRDGADSVSWHADDEPELGRDPVIASVSLGARRIFQMRHKKDRSQRCAIPLEHGSLLLMRGETQRHWLHQIPKTKRDVGARINLTFRTVQ